MQGPTRFAVCVALALLAFSLEGCVDAIKKAIEEKAEEAMGYVCESMVTQGMDAAKVKAGEELEAKCNGVEVCRDSGLEAIDATVASQKETAIASCKEAMKGAASNPQAAKEWWDKNSESVMGNAKNAIEKDEEAAIHGGTTAAEKSTLYSKSWHMPTRDASLATFGSLTMLGGIFAGCTLLLVAAAGYVFGVRRQRAAMTSYDENELLQADEADTENRVE